MKNRLKDIIEYEVSVWVQIRETKTSLLESLQPADFESRAEMLRQYLNEIEKGFNSD